VEGVIEGRKSSGDHQDVERSHIVDERLRPIMSIQRLKMRLEKKAAKTVNNVLTVLSVLLKKAVEWGVIERMPCSITLGVARASRRTERWAIAVRADDAATR
jgi:hypothetical protein